MRTSSLSSISKKHRILKSILLLYFTFFVSTELAAQLKPEQMAEMVLGSARNAFKEKNYPFAVARFREFLARFVNHKEAPAAHYGLALSLLELPEKDYTAVIQELQPLRGNQALPERPYVIYYIGLSQRGLGLRELAQGIARPPEAPQRRVTANQRFEEAAKEFAEFVSVLTAKVKPPVGEGKALSVEYEWIARAQCDLAEMRLRTEKAKEGQASAERFLSDPLWTRSKYRGLGLYYHGFASLLLKEYPKATQSLALLTPFDNPIFGAHARFLLARCNHLTGKRDEAATNYEGVITDYEKQKKEAAATLQQAGALKNTADERARLEALVKGPPPDHVARADLYGASLLYEDGKIRDALTRFLAFDQRYPGSPLSMEVQLRVGFCQVELKQYGDALKTLQMIADKDPRLADQAIFWKGRAEAGAADPTKGPAYEQALKTAIATMQRAADRAQQIVSTDPSATKRRGEFLFEMGDTQQAAGQYREAASTYAQIINQRILPEQDEQLMQRQIVALQHANDFASSDQLCAHFSQLHPKSDLLPSILLNHAENAYFQALVTAKNQRLAPGNPQLAPLFDEAAKRYQAVMDKYANLPFANRARYGMAMSFYQKGNIDKAHEILAAIPQGARTGDLAAVSYAIADCMLRPTSKPGDKPEGAEGGDLHAAAVLLEAFIEAQPNALQTADALLKLGFCYQRLAGSMSPGKDQLKVLADARAAYERLIQQFPNHELRAQASLERARCLALLGDINGGISELERFRADPLKTSSVAPLAMLQLSHWQKEQKKVAEAANTLAQCSQQYEPLLLQDPTRASWVPLLRYHQGVALQEARKLAEARTVFDQIVKQFAQSPEAANAALRWAQCEKEEGNEKIAVAIKMKEAAQDKPADLANAQRNLDEGLRLVREATQYLEGQINQFKTDPKNAKVRAQMLYEAAWGYRVQAGPEIEAARQKLETDSLEKARLEAAKKQPAVANQAAFALPVIHRKEIPLQQFEKKSQESYQALIKEYASLPLSVDARFELAELLSEREEFDAALQLLNEGLHLKPSAELADKIRVRLGACNAAKGNIEEAIRLFDSVVENAPGPLKAQAHYRAGECFLHLKEWNKAAARLAVFRDQQAFQNVPGITDRALLRLGFALAQAGQWDTSRQANETLVSRFPNSMWVHEARYAIGWAWQNQKQFDNAVNAYSLVTQATNAEIGAKAQLQVGLCRLEQKRFADANAALLVVPFTYDYPEINAIALCEAARSYAELKDQVQATKLLERVIKDHPQSKWAQVARERLEGMRGG